MSVPNPHRVAGWREFNKPWAWDEYAHAVDFSMAMKRRLGAVGTVCGAVLPVRNGAAHDGFGPMLKPPSAAPHCPDCNP